MSPPGVPPVGVTPLVSPRHPRVPFSPPPNSFLEADPGEDTCTITQGDIAEAVDIASAAKVRRGRFGDTLGTF